MEAAEAIWERIKSTVAADNGSTGLNNTASPAHIRNVHRIDDSMLRSSLNWPILVVGINTRALDPFQTKDLADCVAEFTVVGDRDQGAGWPTLNRVLDRIDVVFNNVAMANITDTDNGAKTWSFALAGRTVPTQYPATGKLLRRALRFRILATRT